METIFQWTVSLLLIMSALGVILCQRPIVASLSFLFTLILLAAFYLELSAEFIAIMQVLVYAGAILVIFVFVMVLFQDAHEQLATLKPRSRPQLIAFAAALFGAAFVFLGTKLTHLTSNDKEVPLEYGKVKEIGRALYYDFFFPFEAVILLFLIAVIGSLYLAKNEH